MTAGRHYWNAILPLISQPIERELLREPISILLECINDTTDRRMYDKKHEVSKPRYLGFERCIYFKKQMIKLSHGFPQYILLDNTFSNMNHECENVMKYITG